MYLRELPKGLLYTIITDLDNLIKFLDVILFYVSFNA